MESEIQLLREKERDYQRQLSEKDIQISKQKNEWAEIYGSMKQEIEALRAENKALAAEASKNFPSQQLTNPADKEIAKKLKKRELECQALWDTLKDMLVSGKNVYDVRMMNELLAVRALDTKAKRKLKA